LTLENVEYEHCPGTNLRSANETPPGYQVREEDEMLERILDWMVERAMPPFIEDPAQERVAQEAAENGIRQTARVAGLVGGILLVMAAMLYLYLPHQQINQALSEATSAAPQPGSEMDAKLRLSIEELQKQLNDVTRERDTLQGKVTDAENDASLRQPSEDLQKQLDDVTKERDTLQGKLTASEGQVADLNSQLQAAKALGAPKLRQSVQELHKKLDAVTRERDTLQGRVAALEGQVAGLDSKLPAAKGVASPTDTRQPTRPATGPASASIPGSRPSAYQCGDGRTVRNPAACKPPYAPASEDLLSRPSAYQCGDGRTVRNPAACKPPYASASGG
jgi:polyhydroxyalkanoate synthesis regulator phasin